VRLGGEIKELEIEEAASGLRIKLDGEWHEARLEPIGSSSLFGIVIDSRPYEVFAEPRAGGFDLLIGFDRYSVEVKAGGTGGFHSFTTPSAKDTGEWVVLSPMSGVVAEVYVSSGSEVREGDVLLIIEAMKMNNELRAQREGTVLDVHVSTGQRVEPGTALLRLG